MTAKAVLATIEKTQSRTEVNARILSRKGSPSAFFANDATAIICVFAAERTPMIMSNHPRNTYAAYVWHARQIGASALAAALVKHGTSITPGKVSNALLSEARKKIHMAFVVTA